MAMASRHGWQQVVAIPMPDRRSLLGAAAIVGL